MKIAALLNGRAKRVTPRVERDLREALPNALVLVSHDFDEASAHADRIFAERPDVVLSGGGDGAAVKLLNLMHERGPLPILGVLRLGTGNGWARASGVVALLSLHAAMIERPATPTAVLIRHPRNCFRVMSIVMSPVIQVVRTPRAVHRIPIR